jgi:hypothetical protein
MSSSQNLIRPMTVHLKLILLMLQLSWIISFSKSLCRVPEISLELAPRLQSRVQALLPPPSPSMQQNHRSNKIVSRTNQAERNTNRSNRKSKLPRALAPRTLTLESPKTLLQYLLIYAGCAPADIPSLPCIPAGIEIYVPSAI